MSEPRHFDDQWKTIKVISIGGTPFAVQQGYDLYAWRERSSDAVSMESFPMDKHRMVPLFDLIENEEQVIDALDDGVDNLDI